MPEPRPEELVTLWELVAEPGLVYGDTVDQLAHRLGDEVIEDDLGRRCVTRETARRLVGERREREARVAENARLRREELAKKNRVVPAGTPAQEGMTAIEVMAASDDYQTVRDEFGRPAPSFLDDELAAGQRKLAEKQARAKERAGEKMKRDLT